MDHPGLDLLVADLLERADDRLERALHVGLDDERELLAAGAFLEVAHHVGKRAAGAGRAGGGALALLPGAVVGDLAGAGFRLDDGDTVARLRRAVEAEHLDRNRRPGLLRHRALVVDERPDAAPLGAGDGDVAGAQRAALDEHGRDRPAAAVELRLDDRALGRAGAVRPEVEDLGLELQALEQRVEALAGLRRDLELERVAAERLDHHLVAQELGPHPLRVGLGLVDLVDRDDQRDLGGLGVRDRLDRLRHDAVVGGDDQHDDVGHLGAARPHRREGGVARRVDEGDLAAERRGHLIGADVLGDAAGLAGDDVGLADGVEERGLAVVDMAHDGHDRRPRLDGLVDVRGVEEALLDVRFGDPLHGVAELLGDELRGIGVDRVGDLEQLALLHQEADHVDGALRHAVRELLDRDRLRDNDLAGELLLRLGGAVAGQALHAAAERGERARALVLAAGRGRDRQPAAVAVAARRPRRLRRRDDPGRHAGAADDALALGLVLGLDRAAGRPHSGCGRPGGGRIGGRGRARHVIQALRPARVARGRARTGRAAGRQGLLAEAASGLVLGAALALVLLVAALLLVALAGLGGGALAGVAGLALGAALRFLLGVTAILLLADAGVGEGVGARIALRIGQRAQHHAGRARRRRRGGLRLRRGSRAGSGRTPRWRGGSGRGGIRRVLPDRRADTALLRLDDDRFRAAMREALPNRVLLGRPLQRQLRRREMERLLARGFGIRIAHSTHIPADPPSASGVVLRAVFRA